MTFNFIIMTNVVDYTNIVLCDIIILTIIMVILNDIMFTSYSVMLCIGSDIMIGTFVIVVLGNLIVQFRKRVLSLFKLLQVKFGVL